MGTLSFASENTRHQKVEIMGNSAQKLEKAYNATFKSLDTNKDKQVSPDELCQILLCKEGKGVLNKMKYEDGEKDDAKGKDGKFTFQEFADAVKYNRVLEDFF